MRLWHTLCACSSSWYSVVLFRVRDEIPRCLSVFLTEPYWDFILDVEEIANYVQKGGGNCTFHDISGTHTKLHGVVTQTNTVGYSTATKTSNYITRNILQRNIHGPSLNHFYHGKAIYILSLICDNSVTTQNVWFFRKDFQPFKHRVKSHLPII